MAFVGAFLGWTKTFSWTSVCFSIVLRSGSRTSQLYCGPCKRCHGSSGAPGLFPFFSFLFSVCFARFLFSFIGKVTPFINIECSLFCKYLSINIHFPIYLLWALEAQRNMARMTIDAYRQLKRDKVPQFNKRRKVRLPNRLPLPWTTNKNICRFFA